MRLHENARLVHLVFLQFQNLAQRVHLPAHVLHHLVHGVNFHFALGIPFQSEANCHVLSRLHQQRRVFFLLLSSCLGRQASQQLLQVQPRVRIGLAHFFLESFRTNSWIALHLAETSEEANRLNHFRFLQWHHAAFPRGRRTRPRARPFRSR